jgi:hypothetical protein
MDIDIKVRIISSLAIFLTGKQSKLSFLIYKCMSNLSLSNNINFDMLSLFEKPNMSLPYKIMGLVILSKRSNWHCIDKLCSLPFFSISNIAFDAIATCAVLASRMQMAVFQWTSPLVNYTHNLIFFTNIVSTGN